MQMENLNNFNDVDTALKELCALSAAIANIEYQQSKAIGELKEQFQGEAKPLLDEQKRLQQLVEGFCEDNKAEFAQKRAKEMVYGIVGFHQKTSLPIPRTKEKIAGLIKNLENYGHQECISKMPTINRKELEKLSDGQLVKIGLKRKHNDSFRIELHNNKIQELATQHTTSPK